MQSSVPSRMGVQVEAAVTPSQAISPFRLLKTWQYQCAAGGDEGMGRGEHTLAVDGGKSDNLRSECSAPERRFVLSVHTYLDSCDSDAGNEDALPSRQISGAAACAYHRVDRSHARRPRANLEPSCTGLRDHHHHSTPAVCPESKLLV